jgi:hypothetical protein
VLVVVLSNDENVASSTPFLRGMSEGIVGRIMLYEQCDVVEMKKERCNATSMRAD